MWQMGIIRTDKLMLFIILILLALVVHASEYEDCIEDCDEDRDDCEDDCEDVHCDPGCGPGYAPCIANCSTGYSVCTTACSGIDEDGDGVSDDNDSVIGSPDNVTLEGYVNLQVTIGSYDANDSNASTVTGNQTVTFISEGNPIVEFDKDFTNSSLSMPDITIKKEISDDRQGMVVQGLSETKTIYIDKFNDDGALCVKDADINSIDDISSDCTGVNEVFFGRCEDGETVGNYACSVENGRYKIEGMLHSGAVEMNITGFYSGFFTVQYLAEASNHRDGFLMPGESIAVCLETARPLLDDEHLRFVFVPGVGGISINEMWTPQVINTYNVHIYP